ncbi:MAG: peptidase M17, leucyl aminopeptidase [Monoraphidium minutum]|nr:MAG: peptidase M17, leucyl aminopeptidase [Monoraphidium minutum]
MARFLAEAPANVCTPSHLAAAAAHIAALAPSRFTLQVLRESECLALGMRLFVGVAQGSDEPLKLVHLVYSPPPSGKAPTKVALVGKGLTFDSGGLNLKVSGGIEHMKIDMGGAAAVLGAARALADLQPEGVEVHFITAACENMVNGRATRPGDVHLSAAGKTVEVNDTDAEGRLTLADALWYAQEQAGAQVIVDIATLTGAAGVALGQDTGALFSNDDGLAASLDAASRKTGEKLWRLPLNEGLRSKLESPIADLKNYAGRWGGAITAALFLKEFVREGTRWAHLDVAGPAWDDAASLPTGYGAAVLAEWLLARGPGGGA